MKAYLKIKRKLLKYKYYKKEKKMVTDNPDQCKQGRQTEPELEP